MKKEKLNHKHDFIISHKEVATENGWGWSKLYINAMTYCKLCGLVSEERLLKNQPDPVNEENHEKRT